MKTITIKTERIAQAGAKKMSAQGYTFTPADETGTHDVIHPDGHKYRVNPDTDELLAYCGCPFAKENGLCKHQVWLRDELAREEFATFGKYL